MPAAPMPVQTSSRTFASGAHWPLAFVPAALALTIDRGPALLAEPGRCPGVIDGAVAGLARLLPTASAMTLLWWSHAALAVAASAGFWWWIHRHGRRPFVATGLATAFALTPGFAFVLAPPPVAASAAAVLVLCALSAPVRTGLGAVAALACLIAVVPTLGWAAVIAAGWYGWLVGRDATTLRGHAAIVAAPLFAGLAVVLVVLVPALPPPVQTLEQTHCFASAGPDLIRAAGRTVSPLYGATGPLVITLALLGAFTSPHLIRSARAWLFGFLAVASLLQSTNAGAPTAFPALAVVAVWALAASGVRELAEAARRRSAAPVAAIVLAGLMPLLVWADGRARPVDPDRLPLEHGSLSRSSVSRLLAALPADAALVREEAVTDVLLRSLDGTWQRTGKRLVLVPRDADEIRAAMATHGVYALPRAQRALQVRGVELETGPDLLAAGTARVTEVVPCISITDQWAGRGEPEGLSHLAVVAPGPDTRGPFVLYLAGPDALHPEPAGWPARSLRGFFAESFDTTQPDGAARLADAMADDGAPADVRLLSNAHVARVELWRTPDAPLPLPIATNTSAYALLVRRTGASDGAGASLCHAFPFDVRPF